MKTVPIVIRTVHGIEDVWVIPERGRREEVDAHLADANDLLESAETNDQVEQSPDSQQQASDAAKKQ